MSIVVDGIHHITAIASDPKKTNEFYSQTLGLRLVKKTVNQDDVTAYHLFFGDTTGEPGMDLTFFFFNPVRKGVLGNGQVARIDLAVPETSLSFWQERLQAPSITNAHIDVTDPDGLRLRLVGLTHEKLDGGNVWTTAEVPKDVAIRHFDQAVLQVESRRMIEPVLETLGYEVRGTKYEVHGTRGKILALEEKPQGKQEVSGAGTVHHIAFSVEDEDEQLAMREAIMELGLHPTPVIDRFYFKSIYFMTPAGILFEVATKGPGFTADEDEARLGEKLALPPFLEPQREVIEAGLEPF
jgi:glyoxalase family protein